MIGIPIDSFFINAAISFIPDKWTIINGNKRLLAIKRYIDGISVRRIRLFARSEW